MFQSFTRNGNRWLGRNVAILIAVFAIALSLSAVNTSAQAVAKGGKVTAPAPPSSTQYFQDIAVGSFWYNYTSQLYTDGIISGFPCGAPPAGPCVPPANLPYYQPNDNVTRGQMSRYVSQARTQPYSTGIMISTTASIPVALMANAAGGGEAIYAQCMSSGNNCYAVQGLAPTGDYAGYFTGGRGVHVASSDDAYPALDAAATGQTDGVHGMALDNSDTAVHAGGVFTDTNLDAAGVVGYGGQYQHLLVPSSAGAGGYAGASGEGVYGQDGNANGAGVFGDAEKVPGGNGDPSALGVVARSYDGDPAHTGLRVTGAGLATGGFSTGLGYNMMVKYDGSDELHAGDILALDGNNTTVNENRVLGTVKANAQNAGAAIGVAQYRYNIYSAMSNTGMRYAEQADTAATSFHQGDVIQIMVVGQTQVKVDGKVSIGERLSISDSGTVPTKSSEDSIGKVAGEPDANGMVTVFVNFK